MSTEQIVDRLVMELEIMRGDFNRQADEVEKINDRLTKSIKDTEKASGDAGDAVEKTGKQSEAAGKKNESLIKTLVMVTKRARGLFATITTSGALTILANNTAKVNDQLLFMERRLGMSARGIKLMDNAAAMLGGTSGSMAKTMQSLNQGIQRMVIMGDDSMIPFFAALGVGVTDASGQLRDMDDILLDMADSFGRMDQRQAFAVAAEMGLDESTANALTQGRDAMQSMLDMQKTMYVSTQQELEASRELRQMQAYLSAQWEGMRVMLGNTLIPVLTKMTKGVSNFVEYLQRNERTVKNVFEGLTLVIGVMMIPVITKAAMAMWALLSPVVAVAAAVAAVAAGFVLLYDDYKVWAQGGKSLFDWGWLKKSIDMVSDSSKIFLGFLKLMPNAYEVLINAISSGAGWLKMKGFIDDGGVSLNSLAEGFKNLGRDILDTFPILGRFADIVKAVLSRDFKGAYRIAAGIGNDVLPDGEPDSIEGAKGIGGMLARFLHKKVAGGEINPDEPSGGTLEEREAFYEKKNNLPKGIIRAVRMQETGGNQAYIDDPAKYHYGLNAEGRRIAGHTGKVSTAFGPYGILESTGRDPGWGVEPLKDKSLEEQSRFMAEFLAMTIRRAGSVHGGLAGYGEGKAYADSVMGRMNPSGAARNFTRSGSITTGTQSSTSNQQNISVQVNGLQVNTSANSLTMATSDGVAAATQQGVGTALDQIGAGM